MNCYLQIASDAARAAGDRLLSLRGRAAISQKESSHNLVTQADFEAEEIITQWISQRCEAHTFLCEEGGATGTLQDPHLWVIDPPGCHEQLRPRHSAFLYLDCIRREWSGAGWCGL